MKYSPTVAVVERIRRGAASDLIDLVAALVAVIAVRAQLDVAEVAVGLLGIGLVRLRELLAAEVLLLLCIGQGVPAVEIVHPALGDDVRTAGTRLAVGDDRRGRLVLVGGVAGAVP